MKHLFCAIFLCLVMIFFSLFIGNFDIDFAKIFTLDSIDFKLLVYERLPRTLGAFFAGSALGLSSAIFSNIFQNQLASPYTLGIAQAAGFGAALAIFVGASIVVLAILALFFGIFAIFFAFFLARKAAFSQLALLLCGLLIGSLFSAFTAILKYSADEFERLPAMIFFLMGQASGVGITQIYFFAPILIIVFIISLKSAKIIDILSLGAVQAKAFGCTNWQKFFVIFLACVAASISVGLCGIVGFVGISASFFARLFGKANALNLLINSSAIGGIYLLAMDDIVRTSSALNIPLGALCGLFSLPILFFLIATNKIRL